MQPKLFKILLYALWFTLTCTSYWFLEKVGTKVVSLVKKPSGSDDEDLAAKEIAKEIAKEMIQEIAKEMAQEIAKEREEIAKEMAQEKAEFAIKPLKKN